MDKVQKQRGSIVLYKEERNGADYIRIEYVNSQAVALLLAQDTDVEKAGNSSAYMPATAFKLPDFYDRYSPHAYIDLRAASQTQKGIHTAERLPRTAGTEAVQPFHHKSL